MNPLFKKSSILISLAACIFMSIIMSIQGSPLQTSAAPKGIVSLELAYAASEATLIKNDWSKARNNNKTVLQVASRNILIDFIYIGTYGLFFILFCLRSAQILKSKKLLHLAAAISFVACAFDVLENFGMFYTLQKQAIPIITALTTIAAIIKFSLLITVVLLILFCWVKKALQKEQVL